MKQYYSNHPVSQEWSLLRDIVDWSSHIPLSLVFSQPSLELLSGLSISDLCKVETHRQEAAIIALALTMKSAAVALALISVASAQSSSIISVFLPDTDQQTLVGSLVASVCSHSFWSSGNTWTYLSAQDASKTTIAFGCPSGVDSSDCGYGAGQVTATFGPSTFLATEILDPLTVTLNCAVSGTTAASCIQTYVGPIGVFNAATATDDSLTATDTSFNSQITTSVTTTILAQTDM